MAEPTREFQWMRAALELLYNEMTTEQARQLLYNNAERSKALESIRISLLDQTPPQTVPGWELADNLFQGLLAIRIKFEPDEGKQKVELNIAMRQRSR